MSAKPKKQEEEGGGEGAPLWIISFADMMSLLMAFFVMLSTFSNFGPKEEQELKGVLRAALAPYGGWLNNPPKTGVGQRNKVSGQTAQGSEKPTLEQAEGTDTMAETKPKDFRTHKVFAIESERVFWSGGVTFSKQGKDFLNTMTTYLAKVPCRIVISENGPGAQELGINRSIVIAEFLASKGFPKSLINISPGTMLVNDKSKPRRKVEITLLDENTYKQ
jgi:hypothetical protein